MLLLCIRIKRFKRKFKAMICDVIGGSNFTLRATLNSKLFILYTTAWPQEAARHPIFFEEEKGSRWLCVSVAFRFLLFLLRICHHHTKCNNRRVVYTYALLIIIIEHYNKNKRK
jgi:hypothetical protein